MIAGSHVVMWVCSDPMGNDACRFALNSRSLLIEGSSRTSAGTTRYRIRADRSNVTRRVRLDGAHKHLIERDKAGNWVMDGTARPDLDGLVDIDLGFTPATNTLPIRRLDLDIGAEDEVTAAWFDPSDGTLKPLRQNYRRTGENTYHYTAPDHGFEAELTVDEFGAVTQYPGLWQARG